MVGHRGPGQHPLNPTVALLSIVGGGGMVWYGFAVAPIVHTVWLVPVGALLAFWALGRVASR